MRAKRSTLAYANEHRPWQLYREVFNVALESAQKLAREKGRGPLQFKNPLYSLDATVIDLCAEMFDWAKFRRTKKSKNVYSLMSTPPFYGPTFLPFSLIGPRGGLLIVIL